MDRDRRRRVSNRQPRQPWHQKRKGTIDLRGCPMPILLNKILQTHRSYSSEARYLHLISHVDGGTELTKKTTTSTKSQMNDQTKLALFDALLAYLIQSSSAMDGNIKALATGSLVSPLVLNEAIDSAKVLLSKVIHKSANLTLLDCFSCVL
jgi:hypothetical protein